MKARQEAQQCAAHAARRFLRFSYLVDRSAVPPRCMQTCSRRCLHCSRGRFIKATHPGTAKNFIFLISPIDTSKGQVFMPRTFHRVPRCVPVGRCQSMLLLPILEVTVLQRPHGRLMSSNLGIMLQISSRQRSAHRNAISSPL